MTFRYKHHSIYVLEFFLVINVIKSIAHKLKMKCKTTERDRCMVVEMNVCVCVCVFVFVYMQVFCLFAYCIHQIVPSGHLLDNKRKIDNLVFEN